MESDSYRFESFTLEVESRLLRRDGTVVDVSSRYFDALVLLVRNAGGLVSKDRFMDDVWRGIPVTDEALTQCIRSLRRELGDDAATPVVVPFSGEYQCRWCSTGFDQPRGKTQRGDRAGGTLRNGRRRSA